jgi:hypothetical protein
LASVSKASATHSEFDLFGRSAYNRYYYAAFLCVRSALREIDQAWSAPAHKAIPELLRGQVRSRLKKGIRSAEASGQITRSEGKRMFNAVSIAASTLSTLLDSAREVRRVADYEPEQLLMKDGMTVKLRDCSLDTAMRWTRRAELETKRILKVYGDLGLI